jgi:hypothetical protein
VKFGDLLHFEVLVLHGPLDASDVQIHGQIVVCSVHVLEIQINWLFRALAHDFSEVFLLFFDFFSFGIPILMVQIPFFGIFWSEYQFLKNICGSESLLRLLSFSNLAEF